MHLSWVPSNRPLARRLKYYWPVPHNQWRLLRSTFNRWLMIRSYRFHWRRCVAAAFLLVLTPANDLKYKNVSFLVSIIPHCKGANLCWALGGGIICYFTPTLPDFQLWGRWTSTIIFLGELIKWRAKKRSSPTMEHFFPRIQVETCAQMHTRVKLLEGMQM